MHLQDHDQGRDNMNTNQNDVNGQYSEDVIISDDHNNVKENAAASCFTRNLVCISDNSTGYPQNHVSCLNDCCVRNRA